MTAMPCPVDWCKWEECNGDHWASPGEAPWPEVEATAYAPNGRRQYVAAAPTWSEIDALAPAVLLWFRRIDPTSFAELDDTFEFTPDEADALAQHLIRAATAARNTRTETTK